MKLKGRVAVITGAECSSMRVEWKDFERDQSWIRSKKDRVVGQESFYRLAKQNNRGRIRLEK